MEHAWGLGVEARVKTPPMVGRSATLVVLLSFACGCSSEDSEPGASGQSIYVVPESLSELSEETFFDHPWPSDFRKEADGTLRFEGWPNPRKKPILIGYIESMKGVLTGFSPAASGFVRFTTAIDESALPSPSESLKGDAAVQLVDIDSSSPERGQRQRIQLHFRAEEGAYWRPDTLAFMPALGFPLRPKTRYAFVVTSRVRAKSGGRIAPSADLRAALADTSGMLAEPLAELDAAGIGKSSIVHLAVFTTNDPTGETTAIRDFVMASYPEPALLPGTLVKKEQTASYDVYEGRYGPTPNFQKGDIPFKQYGDGGALAFDASGKPEVQSDFDLRFALSVPNASACPMPAAGYPIVLYAHGTGGNYRSFVGPKDESTALAKRCIAVMGIDQIFHGDRPGASEGTPELLFFNVENSVAARANGPQSAIDVVQQARLFTKSKLTIPASVSEGAEIRFDADRLAFMGHSQGGLNGPLFLAIDDQARGGMLSGSGSMISIALLEKTQPIDVAGLVKTVFLGLLGDETEELNLLHPAMSLAQSIVDPTDPIHYVPMLVRRPREGFDPKPMMMTEGVNEDGSGDSYSPPHGIEVQAVALGLPPQTPIIHPIAELAWSDLEPVTIPAAGLSGNLAAGKATGVLAQWKASAASDGHYVLYEVPGAMDQAAGFVANLMIDRKGLVPAP